MNGTKKLLTLTVLAVFVLITALLTSCILPDSLLPDIDKKTTEKPTRASSVTPDNTPTVQPTQDSGEQPTKVPSKDPETLAFEFTQAHEGTWTAYQKNYFMRFYVSGGVPYVTVGDWTLVRPRLTGRVTGAEYDQNGKLVLNFDFSGTDWPSQSGKYQIYSEEDHEGNPALIIYHVASGEGFGFINYPQLQYPMKTETSGCTVAEFLDKSAGYWNDTMDLTGSGYLIVLADGESAVVQMRMWDSSEVIDSRAVKKITKISSATGDHYEIETVQHTVVTEKKAKFIIAGDGSTIQTDVNGFVEGSGDPWTFTKDYPENHREMLDMFMNMYKGTWYDAANNYYIDFSYQNGRPWFRMGTWGAQTPDFSGELASAGFRESANGYVFGAKYEYGDVLVGTVLPGSGERAPIKFKVGFYPDVYNEFKFDNSKQLS